MEYIKDYLILKKYNDNYYKLIILDKLVTKRDEPIAKKGTVNTKKLDNNIQRARAKIFEYSMCNEFQYFVTLTIDQKKYDRYDIKTYIKDLGQFIRDYRKKYNVNIQYLLIPEKHRDGAWHVHGLISGINKEHITLNANGYLDFKLYQDKFGWISLEEVRNKIAVSKYITKYLTKDISKNITELGSKLYYCSRGLQKSVNEIEGKANKDFIKNLSYDFENEYCKIKEFTKQELDYYLNYKNIV